MKKQISPRTISIVFSVLIVCFAMGFYIFAWTEPTATPPGGNVPAPLNVSNIGQTKEGGLILNTGGAPTGLIVDKGNVGIGTTSPTTKLEVIGLDGNGGIRVQGTVFDSSKRSANFDYELANNTVRIYGVGPDISTRPSLKILMAGLNYNNPITPFFINPTGNVGIGNINPQATLDVEGEAIIRGGLRPNYDSGWFFVDSSANQTYTLNHNLDSIPTRIMVYAANSNNPTWVRPVPFLSTNNDYAAPEALWVSNNQVLLSVYWKDYVIWCDANNPCPGGILSSKTGYMRVLLWK